MHHRSKSINDFNSLMMYRMTGMYWPGNLDFSLCDIPMHRSNHRHYHQLHRLYSFLHHLNSTHDIISISKTSILLTEFCFMFQNIFRHFTSVIQPDGKFMLGCETIFNWNPNGLWSTRRQSIVSRYVVDCELILSKHIHNRLMCFSTAKRPTYHDIDHNIIPWSAFDSYLRHENKRPIYLSLHPLVCK